jgi:hypothetical protein
VSATLLFTSCPETVSLLFHAVQERVEKRPFVGIITDFNRIYHTNCKNVTARFISGNFPVPPQGGPAGLLYHGKIAE